MFTIQFANNPRSMTIENDGRNIGKVISDPNVQAVLGFGEEVDVIVNYTQQAPLHYVPHPNDRIIVSNKAAKKGSDTCILKVYEDGERVFNGRVPLVGTSLDEFIERNMNLFYDRDIVCVEVSRKEEMSSTLCRELTKTIYSGDTVEISVKAKPEQRTEPKEKEMFVLKYASNPTRIDLEAGKRISEYVRDPNIQAILGFGELVDVAVNYQAATMNYITKAGDLVIITNKAAQKQF